MADVIEQLRVARRVGAPLVAFQTPDQPAAVKAIEAMAAKNLNGRTPAPVGVWHWDVIRGVAAVGERGKALLDLAQSDPQHSIGDPAELANPVRLLQLATRFPADLFVLAANFHLYLAIPEVIQGLCNLRDAFKANGRCFVLLSPHAQLPPEFAQDTLTLIEPLPDAAALATIVGKVHAAAAGAGVAEPTADVIRRAVDATRGLSAFAAEQVCAMSLSRKGLDLDGLWDRKRVMIEQTPGLSVYRGGERFADLGGLANLKDFLSAVGTGQEQPGCIAFLDEVEKAVAGAANGGGNDAGVSADQQQELLRRMSDSSATGIIVIGPPGTGKSAIAKSFGAECGVPTIQLDLGGMKGGVIGRSEGNIRRALDVVDAVSDGKAFYIATCNSIGALSPELRRRFDLGIWFADLPGPEEQAAIWNIYITKYQLDPAQPLPACTGWTGAEIRSCCKIAWKLKRPLVAAAAFVVPVTISAGPQILALRQSADGKFLSAHAPGLYRYHVGPAADGPAIPTGGRTIHLDS